MTDTEMRDRIAVEVMKRLITCSDTQGLASDDAEQFQERYDMSEASFNLAEAMMMVRRERGEFDPAEVHKRAPKPQLNPYDQ